MHESPEFLRSLEHSNPSRPKFEIGHRMDARLKITFEGQTLEVPISEILNFARRWESDRKTQRDSRTGSGLNIYPYPLYGTRLLDPDCADAPWWQPRDA